MFDSNWKNADIKLMVSAESITESNLVLRKFYDEMSHKINVNWNCQPYREENGRVIFVGRSSFGEMWLDYKEKGKIQYIYISTISADNHSIVETALKEAISNHGNLKTYHVRVKFLTKDISLASMCKENIKIESMYDEEWNQNIMLVTFMVHAFGSFDLQYVVTQKINYLKHLLCAYTNIQFDMIQKYEILKKVIYNENEWTNYKIDWIEYFSEDSISSEAVGLIPDFFDIFRIILDNDSYAKTLRLLLNSAQEIYCGMLMLNDILHDEKYNIPGYVDMASTMLISALEPLAVIGASKPENCPVCGNLKYQIRKNVEKLCERYMNMYMTKLISNIEYGRRSSFLHEGNARTNEFYCGRCVPLIDPNTKNMMLGVASFPDLVLFNETTYIFRHIIHDLLKDDILLYS